MLFLAALACAPRMDGPRDTGAPVGDPPETPAPDAAAAPVNPAPASGGAGGGGMDAVAAPDVGGAPVMGSGGAGGSAPVAMPDTRGIESASISGYQLLVRRRNSDGTVGAATPFDVRGISWSPAERGGGFPDGGAYLRAADRDLPLMRAANINVVKTYLPVDRAVLDRLLPHGIVAIVTVLERSGDDFASAVESLRDHPAVLMWLIGNEWNYNRLYGTCALEACYARINEVARRIKALDPRHPVASSFAPTGEIPSESDLRRLDGLDVWGLNVYSQPGFFNRFTDWRLLAQRAGIRKPILLTEYGADAFNNRAGGEDGAGQAAALRRQTQEIRGQLSARNPELPCLGGTPFEWNDEWWKAGNPTAHDAGGFANQGVAVDQFANEEWWGVVDVDRKPRPAYQVLKELYAP
jgi:hypothetical protein